jgi:hypothetical protein
MKRNRRSKRMFAGSLLVGCLLVGAGSAVAGPPLATDDAGTVDAGKVEIELNGSYTHDRETSRTFDGQYFNWITGKTDKTEFEAKITTGLYKDLGISLTIPYTIDERVKENDQVVGTTDGFGDMKLDIKYAFWELAGINFAIKPSLRMPTGKYSAGLSEGRWQYGATLIATKTFDEGKYAIHSNLGYEHHDYRTDEAKDANRRDLWSGSIAGEIEVLKGFVLGADFGLSTTQDKTTSELSAYALGGARYEITEHLGVHAGLKFGLTKPVDDLSVLYGLVLKF